MGLSEMTATEFQRHGASHAALAALPVAIYMTDVDGTITFFNDAAARFWGRRPEIGKEKWTGAWRLFHPDGTPRPLSDGPMAHLLGTGMASPSGEAMLERPDGSRVWFRSHPTPLYDAQGRISGAVNLLLDITEGRDFEHSDAHLSAIVESSEDAILSKDLDGIIQTWNKGAERIFGYTAQEAIGQPVLMLIPPDRRNEEPQILSRIRNGERVDHFETVRRRKDGSLMDISLTISPVKDKSGRIIGASKIARDISGSIAAARMAQIQARRLDTLNQIAKMLSSDLDQDRIVQAVTDVATELSSARFGAFFYNINEPGGDALQLYTLSGAQRADFEKLGRLRATPLFAPTLIDGQQVRSGDVRKDPRYGRMAPHHGMPAGHLPVVSYMAVPVRGRSGEIIGALLFAHDQPDIFTQDAEDMVAGIAAHAAIALDNARLHKAAQAEVAQRKRAEDSKDLLLHEIKHRVKNTLGTVQAIATQTFRGAPREERDAFGARLRALSEAHDLLTNQDWGHVTAGQVVGRAVAPFNAQRFILSGDGTSLPAATALLLAMVVHELCTNAVKYGALSNSAGTVEIDWRGRDGADGKTELTVRWRETGGPPVTAPTRTGFGTNLIRRALAGEQGRAVFEYAPEGLRGVFELHY